MYHNKIDAAEIRVLVPVVSWSNTPCLYVYYIQYMYVSFLQQMFVLYLDFSF